MHRRNGVYAQYQPSLNITGEPIPPLPLGEDFMYLGRMFNCNMNCTAAISKVECKLDNMLRITNGLHLGVQGKLKIVTRYIHSQVLFELNANDFSLTWVEQTLDANCFRFIRDWLELPISACLKELFIFPNSRGGLGFHSFKTLTEKMRIIKRNTLRMSKEQYIIQVWVETQNKSVEIDELLINSTTLNQATKVLGVRQSAAALSHLYSLTLQRACLKTVN